MEGGLAGVRRSREPSPFPGVPAAAGAGRLAGMKRSPVLPEDLAGIIAVPPLPRRGDAGRPLDFDEAGRLVRHVAAAGITRIGAIAWTPPETTRGRRRTT